jgi:hypothetical protein
MAKTRVVLTRRAFRQGELLFVPLSKEDYSRLLDGRKDATDSGWQRLDTNVLREGEATGHKHEVISRLAATAVLFAPPESLAASLPGMDRITGEDRLLIADGPVEIVHPEHKPLTLPKGIHLVIVQREYDESQSHRVLD